MSRLRWPFEHEPALTLAVLGAVAVALSRLLGVEFTAGQLFTAIAAVLGVGLSTRQLVRPEHRARAQIVASYEMGRADQTYGFVRPSTPDVIRRASVAGKAAQSGKVAMFDDDPALDPTRDTPSTAATEDWSEWPDFRDR